VKLLHVVKRRAGGIGRYLDLLESVGEKVWEVERDGLPPKGWSLLLHAVVPEVVKLPNRKFFFMHGLRSVSRRMLEGKIEFNPKYLVKFIQFGRYLQNFEKILFPSFSMAETARRLYGVKGKVIYLPFEEGFPQKVRVEGRTLLWVGREAWIKGLDTFEGLAEELSGWRFVVVGVTSGKSRRVEYLGRLSWVALKRLYRDSTFLLVTSRYESFSYVTLEAMSSGTPVLVLKRAGGAAELVEKVGLGRVFNTREDLKKYLMQLPQRNFILKIPHPSFLLQEHLKRLYAYLFP